MSNSQWFFVFRSLMFGLLKVLLGFRFCKYDLILSGWEFWCAVSDWGWCLNEKSLILVYTILQVDLWFWLDSWWCSRNY